MTIVKMMMKINVNFTEPNLYIDYSVVNVRLKMSIAMHIDRRQILVLMYIMLHRKYLKYTYSTLMYIIVYTGLCYPTSMTTLIR